MRVLTVCSYNSGSISPFVQEQVNSLRKMGLTVDYFKIKGKGVLGYLKNLAPLKNKIKEGNYDLVHAHYGLSGLLSSFQNIVPTVTTFHGSDVNVKTNRFFSFWASKFSSYNILVNNEMAKQLNLSSDYTVAPCGVDFNLFQVREKKKARRKLGLDLEKKYALFSSAFDNKVKNYPLAKEAILKTNNTIELLELKGRTREEVSLMFNACNLLLMTSLTEGSPQVVKEALACNTPIVSTDVGDVKDLIEDLDNCYVTSYDPYDIASKIKLVLENESKCKGRSAVQKFSLPSVARSVKDVYMEVLKRDLQ